VVLNSEQKTLNYLETNLAPVDHAASPNVGVMESDSNAAVVHASTHRPVKPNTGWLSCVQRREGIMRELLSVMLLAISMVAVVYYIISSALPSSPATQVLIDSLT